MIKFIDLTEEQQKAVLKRLPKKHINKFSYLPNETSIDYKLRLIFRPYAILIATVGFPVEILKECFKVVVEQIKYFEGYSFSGSPIYYKAKKSNEKDCF